MADFHLSEEWQALQDVDSYTFANEHDISDLDANVVNELLEGVVVTLAENSEAILDAQTFDVYRSLLKYVIISHLGEPAVNLSRYASHLQGSTMSKLLDSISSGLQTEIEASARDIERQEQHNFATHRQSLERYAFLLLWFVSAAEKVKATGGEEPAPKPRRGRGGKSVATSRSKGSVSWTWQSQIPPTLALLSKVLRLKVHRLWTTTPDRDAFINVVTRPAYQITESETYMKDEAIKLGVYKVICLAVKNHGHRLGAQISIMQCLQYYDHLSEPMAEALAVLHKEFDHSQLAEDILREVAGKRFSAQDTKGPRAFGRFLVRFAELAPRVVLKQVSLLLDHLDSEAYPMRMALVEILGVLVKEITTTEEGDAEGRERKLASLFELLMERFLDLSSYVRAKVINTLSKLLDLPVKFPQQRLAICQAAVGCLEDKASSVRRYAVALLTKLILTHPYGLMHGGLLRMEEWEERYNNAAKELDALDPKEMEKDANDETEDEDDEDEEEEDGESQQPEPSDSEDESQDEQMITSSPIKKAHAQMRARSRSKSVTRSSSVDPLGDPDEMFAEDGDEMQVEEDLAGPGEAYVPGEAEEEMEMDVPLAEDGLPYATPAKSVRGSSRVPATPSTIARGARTPKATPKTPKTPRTVQKPKKKMKPRKSQIDLSALTNEQAALAALESNQILHLKLRKRYYAEGMQFIRLMEDAMETVGLLLGSTNKAEVLEAIEFFRVSHEYQFESAEAGIKRMLHLIWSKDNTSTSAEDGKELKGIRSRLLECYRSLYLDPLPDLEPKQQVNRITKNLIELTYNASLAELTSLEEMMRVMMEDNQIHDDVVTKLWQVYGSEKQLPKEQRRGAIIVLGMMALARRDVVTDRIEALLKIGLGSIGKSDLVLARYTCVALQRISGSYKKVKGSLDDKSLRLEMAHPIFRKLQKTIEYPSRSREWFAMAEQAINTVYLLGKHPDTLCDDLIRNLTRRTFATGKKSGAEEDPDKTTTGDISMDQDVTVTPTKLNPVSHNLGGGDAFQLSQLIFVVGHVAIKHVVYLELVEREWKRQKDEREKAEKQANGSHSRTVSKDGEELDQVAGNAEDEIGERVAGVREHELLYGSRSLLSLFGPMIVHICSSPQKFKNETLRSAATLALSKFLCVSSQFCERHHRLLFKILEISKDPNIRSNIVIALGDVAVCFSNIVDENSNELYKGLSDHNLVVKKNTLMVLTHLILNGMIKVKGQLGEMAKCLEDEEPRIADLAKLFFTELSTKENAIYNNLPDVISHLSTGQHALEEEAFQSTMRYIFTFIEKEKQAESIVEKLCQRFRLSDDPRQWRDIAFCMSLLPFKLERSMKRLIDGLPLYQDKLHEETVFARFTEILTKARSNKSASKPDNELKEFENILEEFKNQGQEDKALEKRAEVKKAAAKRRANRRGARTRQMSTVDSDQDESD